MSDVSDLILQNVLSVVLINEKKIKTTCSESEKTTVHL